jgi:hypothetical protein
MSETCITYFSSITQNDIPVREINKRNYEPNLSSTLISPCNTWVCTNAATEYECMGLNIELGIDANGNTGYITSYKTLSDWSQTWEDGSCLALFQGMVTGLGTAQSTASFSSNNFELVQEDFNFMFSRYFNQDSNTNIGLTGAGNNPCSGVYPAYITNVTNGATGSQYQKSGKFSNADNNCDVWINGKYTVDISGKVGYNGFLDTLLDACYNVPGACSQMQNYMCQNCTREQIFANPTVLKFCGCSVEATTGDTFYSDALQNFDPVCDPICNRIETIKNINPITGNINQCNANVCVIDNVTINSIASSGITPTFNQVCPACADGQGNCICVIDVTFDSTISSIQGESGEGSLNSQPKFTQYCPNSQCYVINPENNTYVPVECNSTLPKGNGPDVEIPWKFAIICLLLFVVFILAILAYKYQSDNTPIYKLPTKYYQN